MPKSITITPRDPSASQLLQRWKDRRREIRNSLPPGLAVEYRRLGKLIREIRYEVAKDVFDRLAKELDMVEGDPQKLRNALMPLIKHWTPLSAATERTPMSVHKQRLIEFLRGREPATRNQILNATGIPVGSLSTLLLDKQFKQVEHGRWRLNEEAK